MLAVEYAHIVVEQGFLFTRTLYVPTSTVARVDPVSTRGPGRVHLNITSKQAAEIGKNDTYREQKEFVGSPTEKARFAPMLPNGTAGLDPARHTPDDFAAPRRMAIPSTAAINSPTTSYARASLLYMATRLTHRPSSSKPKSPGGQSSNEQ